MTGQLARFIALFALSLSSSSFISANPLYWTYDEFISLNPEQKRLTEEFNAKVHLSASKATFQNAVKVAVVYPGIQASDYWRRSVSSFEARLSEAQAPYSVHNYFSKPGTEIRQQTQHIVNALEHDPDYLIFTLDALKHQVIVERLIAQKKPKIILQNITTPLKSWGKNQPFLYAGFDHAIGTNTLIKAYKKRFPKGGEFAIFYGPKGYVSEMRGGTFRQALSAVDGFVLTEEYYTGFDRQKSKRAALQLVEQHPEIDFIYACSTDIALGIIDALQESGKQHIMTNGWGGGSAELDAIRAGNLEMTVMRINDDNGAAMADAILRDIGAQDVPQIYSGDIVLIDKSMPLSEIGKLKQQAFRYSDHWSSQNPHTHVKKK